MEVHIVADMGVDMAAAKKNGRHGVGPDGDMFQTKCIKPVMFQNEEYWAEAV